MCGRYALVMLGEVLDLPFVEESEFPQLELPWTHYNVCPGTVAPILDNTGCLRPALWGLVPSGAKTPPKRPLFNARSETAAERSGFRTAWFSQRCAVPTSGFYEWSGDKGSARTPYFVPCGTGREELLWLAGLASRWTDPQGSSRWTFSVLTESSLDSSVEALHNRIPVALLEKEIPSWLAGRGGLPEHRQKLGQPYQVSKRVNAASHNDASNLEASDNS